MGKPLLYRKYIPILLIIFIINLSGQYRAGAQNEDYRNHPRYEEFVHFYQTAEQATAARNFGAAIEPLQKALKLAIEIFGENSPTAGLLIDRLGYAEYATGDFDQAITLFNKAVAIYTKVYGTDSEYNASVYINMGETYRSTGDIGHALEYLFLALKIYSKAHGPEHIYVGTTCNYIGGAYKSKGDYDRAIEYYLKALDIYKKTLGDDHEYLATTYTNLGGAYEPRGEYQKAVDYYLKAIPIYQKKLGPDHPFLAVAYNNLGLGYYYLNDGALSVEYYQKALTIYLKNMEENHPHTAYAYINLGLVYRAMNDTEQSILYYSKAQQSLQRSGDRDGHLQVLTHLAELHLENNNTEKAAKMYSQAVALLLKYRLEIGRGKSGFLARYGSIFNSLINLELARGNASEAFRVDTLKKGLSIAEDMSLKNALQRGGVPAERAQDLLSLIHDIEMLESQRNVAIENGDSAGADDMVKQLWSLESKKDALDERLISSYPGYASLRSPDPPSVEKLQQALAPDEALINFSMGDKNCVAFIITRARGLEVVILGQEGESASRAIVNQTGNLHTLYMNPLGKNPLTKIEDPRGNIILWDARREPWKYSIKETTAYINDLQTDNRQQVHSDGQQGNLSEAGTVKGEIHATEAKMMREIFAKKLYAEVLEPVIKKTGVLRNFIIIPDGPLYYMPWGILMDSRGRIFSSSCQHRLAHSSIVWMNLRRGQNRQARYPLLALGNAVYNKGHLLQAKAQRGRSRSAGTKALSFLSKQVYSDKLDTISGQSPYDNLPGTDDEVRAIIQLAYGKTVQTANHMLTGVTANEDRLYSLEESGVLSQYGIIHFAAHGLFVDHNPSMNAIVLTLPDMARRYEEKAYAAYTAHYGNLKRDGYLRLGEIKALDLKCRLVVMSACETSLGDIVQGEGMIGLPQAFLIAGSQAVMASLWPVDDEATFILMEEFYKNMLQKKMGPHEALQKAQSVIHQEYNDPYYWASFVIYGE